jgi:hypothetical protein
MTDDYKVDGRSAKDIAAITLAWRDTLGIAEQWAPSVVALLELSVPKVIRDFALVVRADPEMGDAEAYTEFDPPHIAVRGSVYAMARREDGRSRMTFAHELEHFPIFRNRKGFPCASNRDSSLGLVMEASPHGQTALAGSSSSHYSGRGS